jgi:hypothetical protein
MILTQINNITNSTNNVDRPQQAPPPLQTWTPVLTSLGMQQTCQACQEKWFQAGVSQSGFWSGGCLRIGGAADTTADSLRWGFKRSTDTVKGPVNSGARWLACIKAAAGLAATSAYVRGWMADVYIFRSFSKNCSVWGSALWMNLAGRDSVGAQVLLDRSLYGITAMMAQLV